MMSNKTKRKILVTGASGQLGRRLVPKLLKCGFDVNSHYRSEKKSQRWCPENATPVYGDLLNPDWLDDATRNCDTVIHSAAMVSLRPHRREMSYKINVDGTKAVIDACLKNCVRRLIYMSSIVTIGASDNGQPIDESADFNLGGFGIPYIDTKREAESLALDANGDSLQVIVINPSIMISVPDRELTEKDLNKIPKRVPVYFDFGINLVDTDDVVDGIIFAIDNGTPGNRYLLTGDNINPEITFNYANKYLGIKKPFIRIPYFVLYLAGAIIEVVAKIKNKHPRFHRGLASLSRYRFVYSNEKAKRELGYSPKPLSKVVDTIFTDISKYIN
jgi:dihydroflavonol-4-reductase